MTKKKTESKRGPKVKWTKAKRKEAFELIVEQMVNEGKSIRTILIGADRNQFPSPAEFFKWIGEDAEMEKRYVRACETRADFLFDEGLDIAKNSEGKHDGYNKIQRDRLAFDAIRWAVGKMKPKKYGEKLDITSGDEPLAAPIINVIKPAKTDGKGN